jgi:predicted AlkP superfamily pyrophosphatase or phosphodiesterase
LFRELRRDKESLEDGLATHRLNRLPIGKTKMMHHSKAWAHFARAKRVLFVGMVFLGMMVSARAETPKLVVAILVDQLRYDYLERFQDQFTTNGFRMFLDRGAFMTFARYDYSPTVTGPGHASFLSGSTPAMHGIIANDWIDKKTRRNVYCCDDPSVEGVGTTNGNRMSPRNFIGATFADQLRLHYQSKVVGISMKDRGAILPAGKKPTGAFWFETRSGNFVTSSYYTTDLPDWVKTFNGQRRVAGFADAEWDRLIDPSRYERPDDRAGEGRLSGERDQTFPHKVNLSDNGGYDAIMPTPFGNQLLEEFAEAAIVGERLGQGSRPDLLCVSFSSVDYAGHKFGPYSQEVQDIVLRLDRQLGRLFGFLDRTIGLANVAMVLTADHGVTPTPEFAAQQGLDGGRLNDSAFLVDLMGQLSARFGAAKYLLSPKLYGWNLYFNHDTLKDKNLSSEEVGRFVRDWALSTGKIQACYTREQLLDGLAPGPVGQMVLNGYNAERGGDVVLIPKPFIISGSGNSGTTHGSPYTMDSHVPVLFFGRMFRPGRYAADFHITDIVPTLCAGLHMDEPPICTGRPFIPVLAAP